MALSLDAVTAAIRQIERAFSGIDPPGDDALLHPMCMDDVDVAEFYGAPTRDQLSDRTIIRNYAASSAFSPEAFHYYMPAFMIWALKNHDSLEYAPEATLRAFDPGTVDEKLRAFQISKFELFTETQRRAIVCFLRTFSSDPDLGAIAEGALRNYWR